MELEPNPQQYLTDILNGQSTPFSYLKKANYCLSSPNLNSLGREFLIRALDQISLFEKQRELLQILLRKSGLYPYIKKYLQVESPDINLLLDIYRSNFDENFIFHSMQAKIFKLLMSGHNIVLSAPTSMGKSAIVDALIAENKFSQIVIVVPTIALIDETRRRIKNRFGSEYQIIYHNSQVRHKDKAIYILTQERVNERDDLRKIDIFIIDEFYKLAYNNDEPSRVISLNIALSKLMTISKQFYMIGPYIDAIRGMENLKSNYTFIPSEFNTVALNIHKYDIAATDLVRKNEQLTSILKQNKDQTIIYCKSAASISQVYQHIIDASLTNTDKSEALEDYHEWLSSCYGIDWTCTKAISNGIGIHHGALPRAIQQKNIELFNAKQIQILLCTSTMIEGVNTSAKNIIIYDNRKGVPSIDGFTHKNISGRAGRMNQYLIGNVFCLEAIPEKEAQVVDIPLGQQNLHSPINLLAGIQPSHLSEQSSKSLSSFSFSTDIPIEIIKRHSSYGVEIILEANKFINELTLIEISKFARLAKPRKEQLKIISTFIKTVENGSLRKVNLHFYDNDDLQNRLAWYIYAESHSSYIKDRLSYIYSLHSDAKSRSDATDLELKIVRNIFKHTVTRALLLFEELLNHRLSKLNAQYEIDLGYIIHIFENSHLSSSFSALEEMGVPIETLEKLIAERLINVNIDTLCRYYRLYQSKLKNLSKTEHLFIQQALN